MGGGDSGSAGRCCVKSLSPQSLKRMRKKACPTGILSRGAMTRDAPTHDPTFRLSYVPETPQIINKSMVGIVKSLDSALKANNLEKVAATMDQFEKQFENLDVQSEFVEQAMGNQAALSTPEDEVNLLMQVGCIKSWSKSAWSFPRSHPVFDYGG